MSGLPCHTCMPTVTPTRTDAPGGAGASATVGASLAVERGGVRAARSSVPLGLRQLRDERDGVVRVAVVQTGAMLLDGDDLSLSVTVEAGARLVLCDVSATLAHPMASRVGASWRLSVRAGAGAAVVLVEQPLIVADGARVRREVSIDLAPDARLLHRETLVLGRHGEEGGAIRARTRVLRAGRPVFDDTLDTFEVAVRSSPAVLGDARVVGSLSLFGCGEELESPEGLLLASGDQLVRRLGDSTVGLAELDALERRWAARVLAG